MQTILKTGAGQMSNQMLFDSDRMDSAQREFFDPDWWQARSAVTQRYAGRGQALAIEGPFGSAVLKQYLRGGWVRHISQSSYLYLGADRTRSFHEWRVTEQLWQAGLPVAEPLAAWFERTGLHYRAALITRRIDHSQTLAERSQQLPLGTDDWVQVGQMITRFAAFGLRHPDLNANNILIDTSNTLWMIDFDRAQIKQHACSPDSMVQRLLRSLDKLSVQHNVGAIELGLKL